MTFIFTCNVIVYKIYYIYFNKWAQDFLCNTPDILIDFFLEFTGSCEPDSAAVFRRSLGMYKWVQSVGTLWPVLEPFSFKTQHKSGLGTSPVNILQNSDTSPRRQKGKLPPGSFTQNKWSAKRVRESSTPGIWLYTRWSSNTCQNTGNRRNIHPRIHKLLKQHKERSNCN